MKIAFILGLQIPFPGAAWTRISYFAKIFSEKNHDVSIIGVYTSASVRQAESGKYEHFRIFNMLPLFPKNLFLTLITSTITFVPLMLALRADVIIVSLPPGELGIAAFLASKLSGSKIIFDYRGEWEDFAINKLDSKLAKLAYRVMKFLMTCLYSKSDYMVTETSNWVELLQSRGVSRLKLLPNGVDTTIFKPNDIRRQFFRKKLGLDKDFVIIFCGKLGDYYALDVVIKALAQLQLKQGLDNVKLVIIGHGDVTNVLRLAEDLNITRNVLYLGTYDHADLAEILTIGDVGVIPLDDNTLWKNCIPSKFSEYGACGIPVIATMHNDSIIANLIHKYQVGLIVPPLDSNALEYALKKLYLDKNFRLSAGENARTLIKSQLDGKQIATQFLELLQQLIRNDQPKSNDPNVEKI